MSNWISQMDIENKMRLDSLRKDNNQESKTRIDQRWNDSVKLFNESEMVDQILPETKPVDDSNRQPSNVDEISQYSFQNKRPMQMNFDRVIGVDTRQEGKKTIQK